jgi:hypothetical protein
MPPFEAQPRIIFESPTGKAEPFLDVRRQSRASRFFRDPSTKPVASSLASSLAHRVEHG